MNLLELLSDALKGLYSLFLSVSSISGFPPRLPKEEEKRYIELAFSGDKAARTKLIEHNLRLVAHVSKKYAGAVPDPDDLISIGTIGLIKAVDTFRPDKGSKFSSYAAACIWNGMLVRCKVTDSAGDTVYSSSAKVTLLPDLKITSQPADVSVKVGGEVTFTVKASGSGLKYQWYYKKSGDTSWSVWNGRTTASTTAASNATWNGMLVRCKVTDSSGDSVYSSSARVSLN